MLSSKNIKLLLISIVTIFLLVHCVAYKVFSCTIILEIEGENREKEICLHSDDINKIGINERLGGTRVEISIAPEFVPVLSKLTEQNIGNKLAIRTQTEIIFSGTIVEPIIDGIIVFPVSSEEHAKTTIKKIKSRTKSSYCHKVLRCCYSIHPNGISREVGASNVDKRCHRSSPNHADVLNINAITCYIK